MQKKLLIPIVVVLVIAIVLITRGCGKKDTKQGAEQEERQHQRQQMDISRMLTESDGLTSELVDLLIEKIYVYTDKRVDIAFKIRESFTTHD